MEFNATFIVAFVNFIIFILIMNWILYEPINKIVQERQDFIDNNYNEAKNNISKSQSILKDRDDKLSSAKAKVKTTINDAIENAKNIKKEKMQNSKAESLVAVEEHKNIIEKEKQEAIDDLNTQVVELAQLISDKLLKNHEKIENVDEEYLKI